MIDLFGTLDKIYVSKNVRFVNELDTSVATVPMNILLARYYRNAHVSKYLNKYAFVLHPKHFAALAWSHIQPKLMKAPFVGKIEQNDDATRYDFLLNKIRKRLEISDNDWKLCKDSFLQDVKDNTMDYLIFYGCRRQEWNQLGLDFDESKKIQTTEIVEGLGKWC